MTTTLLSDAPWRHRTGLDALVRALDGDTGTTRFVGGAVRDTLLGLEVQDVDLATRLTPDDVLVRLAAAGIKAVPTGLAHGTITAVLEHKPYEITTLRRDVATDGRRATVAYTGDWAEDAARRDFTINALSADPLSGEIFDYFGGLEDLNAGRVRFIGDPRTRIAEDHLRILRFFRFQARFGRSDPDSVAIEACAARANDLMTLSRERIADELLKLLGLPDPAPSVALMTAQGIFSPVLPEIVTAEALAALIAQEQVTQTPPASLRRLAALLPADPARAENIANRLKLSKAQRKHLIALAARAAADCDAPRALAYYEGLEVARDRLLLGGFLLDTLEGWTPPKFPLSGRVLIAHGLMPGPQVATTLKLIETAWVKAGFPDGPGLEALIDPAF
ncbi:MAG: CCA tRNA nucleotidyltransferase [Alphaproteobacteria bacterium]|nr:CCA tRNA nucleotidyltransferase [Alphaproteobacteria bacterium]MDE2042524.1 CCA tRNA nucleotidyltransferase [Alphaproteobacteria bacterium]MDE2341108.1 CCA tRNA nucleotidyltransferase [Alphaproteobacteria bacterium]